MTKQERDERKLVDLAAARLRWKGLLQPYPDHRRYKTWDGAGLNPLFIEDAVDVITEGRLIAHEIDLIHREQAAFEKRKTLGHSH